MPQKFTTTRTRSLASSSDAVMATLRDARTWARWQPEIRTAEGSSSLEAGDVVQGTAEMLGFGVNGHSTVTAVEEARFAEDAIVGVRMEIDYVVETSGEGRTSVTHRMVAHLPTGGLGRVLSWFLRKRLVRMQRDALDLLADQVEASS